MATWIIGIILLILAALAVGYMVKVKQTGGCIGCPDAKSCHCNSGTSGCAGCTGCETQAQGVPENVKK